MSLTNEALARTILILSLSILSANSESFHNISFDIPSFQLNDRRIIFQGTATVLSSVIQLTVAAPLENSLDLVGRAIYNKPMHLWDSSTGNVADFVSHFTFAIDSKGKEPYADGLAFFLALSGSQIPEDSSGSGLGIQSHLKPTKSSTAFVAVEFDTFYGGGNAWDPPCEHVGIDVKSLASIRHTCVPWMGYNILHGERIHAQVTYDSRAMNLSVIFGDNAGNSTSLHYHPLNLTEHLPEWVDFGFSAGTGKYIEAHTIFSWQFNSSLRILDKRNGTTNETKANPPTGVITRGGKSKSWVRGAALGFSSLVLLILVVGFGWYRCNKRNGNDQSREEEDLLGINEGFEKSKGPKKYSYKVLVEATNNFASTRLLGEGGFGGVYEGHLADENSHVAIKKITPESKQGLKEYSAEVKTIRHLRHKNLVELIGWCHEKNKLLLIYEFMSNGSLDSHLFKDKAPLTWERYNIAQGIALGLKYLHEELKQCVVHRDIKSSNILLDTQFEAKLGDFGLARIVDHTKGSQTTQVAGTLGYLAPECIYIGKASKESDIYSFGVVLLEIACGRQAIKQSASEDQVHLVEWVWGLYGTGKLLDAADPKLGENFDATQMECLMIVGLWCVHPDPKDRPLISKAISVLNFDASPPILPPKVPIPTYIASPSLTPEWSLVSSASFRSITQASASNNELSVCTCSSKKSGGSSSSV